MKLSKRNIPSLLSVIASLGVIGTAILSAKATPKAVADISENGAETTKEKFKAAWKNYIPAAASGLFTIGCILTSNGISKKQQDALMASYIALSKSYSAYKSEIIERHGVEEHREIMCMLDAKRAGEEPILRGGEFGDANLNFGVDEEEVLFYDMVGGQYFYSTIGKVLRAEYRLNREFCLQSEQTMDDFYEYLGLDRQKPEKQMGWAIGLDGLYWIDFNNYKTRIGDLECLVVEPSVYPDSMYRDYDVNRYY